MIAKLLYVLYQKIKSEGEAVKKSSSFGGIWSQDSWSLGNLKACLQDDGYTQVVMASDGSWSVRQTADFPVVLVSITEAEFERIVSESL